MNPSAQPWYPPAGVALEVSARGLTATRWQNDPYRSQVARGPPAPLCGDEDFNLLRIESLAPFPHVKGDAEHPTPASAAEPAVALPISTLAPATVTKGQPYRSSGVIFAGGPARPQLCFQKQTQPKGRFSVDVRPLWRGDLQEAEAAAVDDKRCGASVFMVKPALSIPLPRSQLTMAPQDLCGTVLVGNRGADPHTPTSAPGASGRDPTLETPAVSVSGMDAITTDGENNACVTSSPTDDSGSTDRNHTCSEDAEESNCDVCTVKLEVQKIDDGKEEPQCDGGRTRLMPTAPKKAGLKPKREEKWTIVGGKAGAAIASLQATAAVVRKVNTSVTSTKTYSSATRHRSPDPKLKERPKAKQQQPKVQHREETNKSSSKVDVIVEQKSKRNKELRRSRERLSDEELLETLMSSTTALSQSSSPASTAVGGGSAPFAIMGVPLARITRGEDLLPSQSSSRGDMRQQNALRLFVRSLAMFETSNAKMLLLQRALSGLPESCHQQCPSLVCAIMLEMSASSVDVEKSLQTCYKALRLAEKHNLDTFEMLSRLAITRTLARVVDTVDAQTNLSRAAVLAIEHVEKAALAWIVMQMGVTLEISGLFPDSLAWYEVAERLARATGQRRLLCDVHCCQSIAYSAVGELKDAERVYEASRELLSSMQRHRHQRPLQNYAQLKCQLGDMRSALQLQEEELAIAKELGDAHAASRCVGAIALTKRFLGHYDDAAENYMEEFSIHFSRDPRQAVESLTGAAACWRLGGHVQKAYDYCVRALGQARDCHDLTTIAKALVELAETELNMNRLQDSREHLCEALTVISRVDDAEQKQYLVKAALCETEWRCCSALGHVHMRCGEVFEALQCTDRCHVPNTVHVERLLLRRQRRLGAVHDDTNPQLVTKQSVERVLRHSTMRGWTIVCYSLPWAEGLDFTVYVLTLDASSGELRCTGHSLVMSEELVAFVFGPNGLWGTLDTPLFTDTGERLYGDTPLWPQLYSKVAFDFQQNPDNADRVASLRSDPQYCLRLLYDSFVRPLEADIAGADGLMFVGDGTFSRIPFHALHNGETYLAERFCTSTCCSMALLCTHVVEAEATKGLPTSSAAPIGDNDGKSTQKATPRRYTIVDDISGNVVLMDPLVEKMSTDNENGCCSRGVVVRRWIIDGTLASSSEDTKECPPPNNTTPSGASSNGNNGNGDEDPDVAAARRLLARLQRRGNVTSVRNALYRAVHETPEGVLELRLCVVPEVKEDYCGSFVGASYDVCASHANEVANSWELRGYSLVMCSGTGTYGGLSMHETGVPVYRALQYAGARCMLLATGSRVPPYAPVPAAAVEAALNGRSVAAAVREAYVQAIAEGVPLADWCGFGLVGLPTS